MSGNDDGFLSRWARRKAQHRAGDIEPKTEASTRPDETVPDLPSLDSLTPESDFSAFMHPGVEDRLRRLALRKLFSDPHFNCMDGLDVYVDDYGKPDPIPDEMMRSLVHARNLLGLGVPEEEQEAADMQAGAVAGPDAPAIEASSQDVAVVDAKVAPEPAVAQRRSEAEGLEGRRGSAAEVVNDPR